LRLFWDIGGAGAKADAMAIWVVQWAGQEIRVLDYLEGQGQVLGYYTNELRHRGYGKSLCYLPHRSLANWGFCTSLMQTMRAPEQAILDHGSSHVVRLARASAAPSPFVAGGLE